jgi:hypothetical protein
MALVSAIVNGAYEVLTVVDAAGVPDAAEASTAVRVLNQLCARLEANGLALGWKAVDSVTDTLPAPDEAHEALIYQLALRLNGRFGSPMSDDDKRLAERFLNDLRRDRAVEMPLKQESRLVGCGSYNVYTDA